MRVKYVNMAARRNLQSLSDLVKAITRLSQNSSGGNDEDSEDTNVEATIRSLFPSTNGQSAQLTSPQERDPSTQNETRVVRGAEHERSSNNPDRRTRESSERFVPNRKYGGKKRSKSVKNNANKKPKGNEQRNVLKDVILIPGPKEQKVPRGTKREALFSHGFTTTIELNLTMNESDIRALLEEKFANKFASSQKCPKFEFVRGVHNKIISIESKGDQGQGPSCDARLLKHISGQGPIYIRANESITILPDACVTIKDESSSSEGNATDDEYTILRTTMHQLSPTSTSTANRTILDGSPSTSGSNQNESTNTIARLVDSTPTQSSIQRILTCPTCYEKFGIEEIEEHADVCAESVWSGSEQQYVSLMSNIVNPDDHVDQEPVESITENTENTQGSDVDPDNIKTELADVIRTLQVNLGPTINRINVQRKSVLDDYILKRTRCSWFSPQNKIKVIFMGEPAIDDGGPRREFFAGKCTMCPDVAYSIILLCFKPIFHWTNLFATNLFEGKKQI
jgi:hypothetical protein